ncbi:MAG: hypothetical protein ACREMS_13085 [Gemmatimonadaceae bacterium]
MVKTRPMVIRIKKSKDGRTALSCVRPDGTITWQRQEGGHAAFFPRHDLTHYAVETTLSHRQGFYGLVASGWDFSDFGSPWPRGRLPVEANISEIIVGFFDLERSSGDALPVEELNEKLAQYSAENGIAGFRELSENDISRIRQKRGELFARWESVRPGDTLEVPFEI